MSRLNRDANGDPYTFEAWGWVAWYAAFAFVALPVVALALLLVVLL